MPALADPMHLLPPSARAELDRYPLTASEAAPHVNGPLGAVAGWYYCGAGCGLLALALHELTGLPFVGLLHGIGADGDDLPFDLVLQAGVGHHGQMLCACGWRAAVERDERLVGVDASRVRALCEAADGVDPDDPPTADAARAAARVLLDRVDLAPR